MTLHDYPSIVQAEIDRRYELAGVDRHGTRRSNRPRSDRADWADRPLGARRLVAQRRGVAHRRTIPQRCGARHTWCGRLPAPTVTALGDSSGVMIGTVPPPSPSLLVGRHEELGRVRAALGWDEGGGGAVLLGGDAGIGKTAVVSRLIEDAAQRLVLVGHCVGEAGTTLPYLPFVEMLASLDARDRDLVDELVAAYPGLVALVPRLAGGVRGNIGRADLVEAVHGTLAALGRRGPVLVVVRADLLELAEHST